MKIPEKMVKFAVAYHMRASNMGLKEISEELDVSKMTVKRWLDSIRELDYKDRIYLMRMVDVISEVGIQEF